MAASAASCPAPAQGRSTSSQRAERENPHPHQNTADAVCARLAATAAAAAAAATHHKRQPGGPDEAQRAHEHRGPFKLEPLLEPAAHDGAEHAPAVGDDPPDAEEGPRGRRRRREVRGERAGDACGEAVPDAQQGAHQGELRRRALREVGGRKTWGEDGTKFFCSFACFLPLLVRP